MVGMIWTVCVTFSSLMLPHKLDDDVDSLTWDAVFLPIWAGYFLHCLSIYPAMNSGGALAVVSVCTVGVSIYQFVTMILIHVKLTHGGLSWTEAFIPMIIFFSLLSSVLILQIWDNYC